MKMRCLLLAIAALVVISTITSGCGSKSKDNVNVSANDIDTTIQDSVESVLPSPDTLDNESEYVDLLTWLEMPCDDKPLPLSFEKWLKAMDYIYNNNWKRPTSQMLADIGLKKIYEVDAIDSIDGIKNVEFMYGRQVKITTDSTGRNFFKMDGDHAITFNVSAHNSSSAYLAFNNAADLQDFLKQAVKRGVVELPDGGIVVSDKPMGKGIHKIKKIYEYTVKNKGAYGERYYLYPDYVSNEDLYICSITTDFLRHRFDIED